MRISLFFENLKIVNENDNFKFFSGKFNGAKYIWCTIVFDNILEFFNSYSTSCISWQMLKNLRIFNALVLDSDRIIQRYCQNSWIYLLLTNRSNVQNWIKWNVQNAIHSFPENLPLNVEVSEQLLVFFDASFMKDEEVPKRLKIFLVAKLNFIFWMNTFQVNFCGKILS